MGFSFAPQPAYITVEDLVMGVTPTQYMTAVSVDIEVLDGDNRVLATAQTTPGQTVYFNYTGNERKVLLSYHVSDNTITEIEIP